MSSTNDEPDVAYINEYTIKINPPVGLKVRIIHDMEAIMLVFFTEWANQLPPETLLSLHAVFTGAMQERSIDF